MNILLSEQLKQLRRERGNTQEDLANHLGISTQAVSKWERGEGYPDITLLPAISSYYNVSIDNLLGVGKLEKEKKLLALREKDAKLSHDGKSLERIALWREAKKEFPNSLSVLYNLMYSLFSTDLNENADEIIACGDRILEESTDNILRNGAFQCLCLTYYYAKKDVESAKKYASMGGNYSVTANELMVHILEGEEAVRCCQANIQELMDKIHLNTLIMCSKGEYTPGNTIRMCDFLIDCFDLLYSDGNCGFYHVRYFEIYEQMAQNYLKMGKRENSLTCLEKAADHAIQYDTLKEGAFTSFMVNKIEFSSIHTVKTGMENCCARLLNALNSQQYVDLRDDPRRTKIVEQLKAHK